MKPAVARDLSIPPTGDWLFDFRRRDLGADSPGLKLDAPSELSGHSITRSRRFAAGDPLAECRAFAVGWEAPPPPTAEDCEALDVLAELCP